MINPIAPSDMKTIYLEDFLYFRCNMTLTPHPDKDELIMFGGEYFNGRKVRYVQVLCIGIETYYIFNCNG